MPYGLILRLRHTGTTTQSIILADLDNGKPETSKGSYVVRNPNGGSGPALDLVFGGKTAISYEIGEIRGHLTAGRISAEFVIGSGLQPALGGGALIMRVPFVIAPNGVVTEHFWMHDAKTLSEIEVFISGAISTSGTWTLTAYNGANNLLGSASFNLKTVTPGVPTNVPLTGTLAHRNIAAGDVITLTATSNNPDLTSGSFYCQAKLT